MTAPITLRAPAKLNVGLEVTGRRPDGSHELVTIFQAIALHDTLTVAPAADLTLTVESPDDPAGAPALADGDNRVLRAAQALNDRAGGPPRGATLTLVKRIPVAAGLGGGSSDAAAALIRSLLPAASDCARWQVWCAALHLRWTELAGRDGAVDTAPPRRVGR